MNKLLRKQLSNQRGVTLIELLAVIVIIGIIAAVAVPAVLNQIDNSKVSSDVASIGVINSAIDRYYVEKGTYPTATSVENLVTELQGAKVLKEFPNAPKSGGAWTYDTTTHKVSFPKVPTT